MKRYIQRKLRRQKLKYRLVMQRRVDDYFLDQLIKHMTKKIENPEKATMSTHEVTIPRILIVEAGVTPSGSLFVEFEES